MPSYNLLIEDGDGNKSYESSYMGVHDGESVCVQVIGLKGDATETVKIQMTTVDDRNLPEEERGWTTCLDHTGSPMIMAVDDIQQFDSCNVMTRAVYDGDKLKDENSIKVFLT
ncbi:hypothetical protein AGMMS49543_20690 [Betaproteobacteria bacterium]|nr:hypothetical protein AGMMS49543_20690 [Betaproteobacteria bacterium]